MFSLRKMWVSYYFASILILQEKWLAGIQPYDLRMRVGVYFGSIKMKSRTSTYAPVVTAMKKDSYGGLSMDIEFPEERYIYDMLDVSHYDVERELGAYPYAILTFDILKTDQRRGRHK